MAQDNHGEFSVGEVLSKGFETLFRNVVPFTIIGFILWSPVTLSLLYLEFSPDALTTAEDTFAFADDVGSIFLLIFGFVLLFILLYYLIYGTITYGAIRDLQGQRVGIGEVIGRGFSTLLPVLGVSIVSGLAIGLGTLFFIIPGIIVAVMLFVAIPVVVLERLGVFESLSRSSYLTAGFRWQVFGISLVYLILNSVISGISQIVLLELGSLGIILDAVITAGLLALGAVIGAVTYLELRRVKEGVDVDTIAKVFS